MKMTKIESARIIAESTDTSACWSILCSKCFNSRKGKTCKDGNLVAIEKAKAYIKRHESKTKKKDHILDTTKKVTRPNFRKYLRDKIDMKVRVTTELILELEKICKDEGVYHWNGRGFIEYGDNPYMLLLNGAEDCEYSVVFSYKGRENTAEYNPETDTLVEKVEEPKPIKTVGIDNSDVTLALTAQHEPVKINIWVQSLFDIDGLIHRGESVPASRETAKEYYFEHINKWYAKDLFKSSEPNPLQIAKMIRDNGYKCIYKNFDDCRVCPFISAGCGSMEDDAPQESKDRRKKLIDDYISANESTPLQIAKMIRDDRYRCLKVTNCKGCPLRLVRDCGNGTEFAINEQRKLRKKLIDDYISEHEPVKDCPVNSEYPDPIRVDIPDIFYCPTHQGILRFKRSHIILKDTNNEDCLLKLHDEYPCYRTLEEAVIVAKKLWNGEGK